MLENEIEAGNVSSRAHPDDPDLRVLNYTHQAQWDRAWNDVTRQSRGLIVRGGEDPEVIARPWPKFFNVGEHDAEELDLHAPVRVQDKFDGSLGILYPHPKGGYAIATRGSFESEQAVHATEIWRKRYSEIEIDPAWTYLFEIIYPGNRVVIDYGSFDDLVLLDILENGRTISPEDMESFMDSGWFGETAHILDYTSLEAALAAEPRPNAEGLVVTYEDGRKVKLKQEDYVILHRLVTGLNERTVWEHLRAGNELEELIAPLPDEFRLWAERVAHDLLAEHARIKGEALMTFEEIRISLDDLETTDAREYRKQFAALATKTDHAGFLFKLLDEKDITDDIWKTLRPVAFLVPREIVE